MFELVAKRQAALTAQADPRMTALRARLADSQNPYAAIIQGYDPALLDGESEHGLIAKPCRLHEARSAHVMLLRPDALNDPFILPVDALLAALSPNWRAVIFDF